MAPNFPSHRTTQVSSSSYSLSTQSSSLRRQRRHVPSLGDPSLSSADCYTSAPPSHSGHERRRRSVPASNAAAATNGAAASQSSAGLVDLSDVRLTSRDTDQQTIIWNEMTASRRKLEEENQILRDKLLEAQFANRVLRVKVKQGRGIAGRAGVDGGMGGILARGLDRGNLRAGSSSGSQPVGLLQKVFSRKDAFRNPAAPGVKRFKVQRRGLALPSTDNRVQHVFPLPDRDDEPLPSQTYRVARKSSGRTARTLPSEIVVPASASSPETVPESAPSSLASPATSPSSSQRQVRPRPPEPRNRTHQKPQQQQEQAAYSLMRVLPLRRQGTTESTVTVHHSNHDNGEYGISSISNRNHRKPPGPSLLCSAPDLPILVEEEEGVSGCQPGTMMMITSGDLPSSFLERLAGARIGSFHDPDDRSAPRAAIVLSACTPMWYDPEAETQYYTHGLHQSNRY